MPAVARLTDFFDCGVSPKPTITAGSGNVFINNLPVTRETDPVSGHCPPLCGWAPSTIASGSSSVFDNNLALARIGDPNTVHCCGHRVTQDQLRLVLMMCLQDN